MPTGSPGKSPWMFLSPSCCLVDVPPLRVVFFFLIRLKFSMFGSDFTTMCFFKL